LEIETEDKAEQELTNEHGELKQFIGGYVTFVSSDIAENWSKTEKDVIANVPFPHNLRIFH
jgi:hypothetical protein